MDIIDLLASDSYIIFNKEFAKKYGVEEAILLGAMCGYQKGFKGQEFYREQDKILGDTSLTLYGLRNATKTLQQLGVLEIVKKGLPAKYYYKINEDALYRSTRPAENDSTGHIKSNITINKNNNNNNDLDIYKQVIAYLNDICGTKYKDTIDKSKQLIRARLNEGFCIEDFKNVIDKKYKDWHNDDFKKYLRPQTLFGTKFESYLNESDDTLIGKKPQKRNYTKNDYNNMYDDIYNIKL